MIYSFLTTIFDLPIIFAAMSFVYPAFLFALSFLAVPIIVHLFNFRRYKVLEFPNTKFLFQLTEQTQSRSRLKHLLILLVRILAFVCLVLAFAQPIISENKQIASASANYISIYIDNSFSISGTGEKGILLEEAKNNARSIVNAYNETDRFQIITNDFLGKHQRWINKTQINQEIDLVQISPNAKAITEVSERQNQLFEFENVQNKNIYLISDFRKNMANFSELTTDSIAKINLIPLSIANESNVAIDSMWFNNPVHVPNGNEELLVRIVNFSDKNFEELPLKLFLNGIQKSPSTIELKPFESKTITINFNNSDTGIIKGKLSISDLPITFDNDFYFTFNVKSDLKVLAISETETDKHLIGLLKTNQAFKLTEMSSSKVDFAVFSDQNAIIIDQVSELSTGFVEEINKFLNGGGSVIFIPSTKGDVTSYNNLLAQNSNLRITNVDTAATKIETINFDNEILKGVFEKENERLDLPKVSKFYKTLSINKGINDWILKNSIGESFITQSKINDGNFYFINFPVDKNWNNFFEHAIFVPTISQMLVFSQRNNSLYYTIGNDIIRLKNRLEIKKDEVFKLASDAQKNDFFPGISNTTNQLELNIAGQISESGFYGLSKSDRNIDYLAFNYNRKESDLSISELNEIIPTLTQKGFKLQIFESNSSVLKIQIQEANFGIKLWRYFLIFSLLFFIIEILLIKFFKK